jgi:hypothetical protein
MPVSRTRFKRNKSNGETVSKSGKHRSQIVAAAEKRARNRERRNKKTGVAGALATAEKNIKKLTTKK